MRAATTHACARSKIRIIKTRRHNGRIPDNWRMPFRSATQNFREALSSPTRRAFVCHDPIRPLCGYYAVSETTGTDIDVRLLRKDATIRLLVVTDCGFR